MIPILPVWTFLTTNIKPMLITVAVVTVGLLVKSYHFDVISDLEKSNTDLKAIIKTKDANITTLNTSVRLLKGKLGNKEFECKQKGDIADLEKSKEKVEDVKTEKITYPDANGTSFDFNK